MNKYLIEFSAVVGRKKADVSVDDPSASLHTPVQLRYFGVLDAASEEEVNNKIVLYRDPGFVTTVVSITEVPESWKEAPYLALMKLETIVTDLG